MMGLLGHYIDGLPPHARDRVIQAQDWCVAAVAGPDGARCLVGHAEDWRPLAADDGWWTRWTATDAARRAASESSAETEVEMLCRPELFAFRRARPADLAVYRQRLRAWGTDSEARIGARFDRLCARRGFVCAVRAVKRRAGRAFAPEAGVTNAGAPRPAPAMSG
jgi:hypothetical protein